MKIKTTLPICLAFLCSQLQGQIIEFSQRDSVLTVVNDTTFTKADHQLFNGFVRSRNENELTLKQYKNGLPFMDSCFYATQKIKAIIRYKDTKTTDRFLFDSNGNKLLEEIYLDSTKSLKQAIWWHPNGQIWKIELYFNGQKSGKWYEWFQNGNLLFEGEFNQGEKVGEWTYYNAQTKEIIRQEKY
ncbi:MAG: hypothetical protein RLZZ543_2293 [Bacteroidota bacterium]|jgi:antitoxin component YwqK of YwqJK toxin-antitoxin module